MVCAPPHLPSQKLQSVPVSHSTSVSIQKIQQGVSCLQWVGHLGSPPALPGAVKGPKLVGGGVGVAGLLWAPHFWSTEGHSVES